MGAGGGGAEIVVPCKIPIARLHVKEPSVYGAFPPWSHAGNTGKIKVSLRRRSLNFVVGIRYPNQTTNVST